MTMNKEGKSYTLLYASGLVVFVSLILAYTAEILKDKHIANEELDKKKQILASINISVSEKETEATYRKMIEESFLVDVEGNRVDGDAFAVNMKKEMSLPERKRKLPVYVAQIDGEKKYVLEMSGAGLWGPIWGQIALDSDKNTVFGANIEHDSETPGLGAEVHSVEFGRSFIGKKIINSSGTVVSIAVIKPGGRHNDERDFVDGISGGTITSHGVDAMLLNSLRAYTGFLTKKEEI